MEEVFPNTITMDDLPTFLEDKGVLLMHASWCGFCKSFMPTWKELTKTEGGDRYRCIDADANQIGDFTLPSGVRLGELLKGFPTIILFDGTRHALYGGERTLEAVQAEARKFFQLSGGGTGGVRKISGNALAQLIERPVNGIAHLYHPSARDSAAKGVLAAIVGGGSHRVRVNVAKHRDTLPVKVPEAASSIILTDRTGRVAQYRGPLEPGALLKTAEDFYGGGSSVEEQLRSKLAGGDNGILLDGRIKGINKRIAEQQEILERLPDDDKKKKARGEEARARDMQKEAARLETEANKKLEKAAQLKEEDKRDTAAKEAATEKMTALENERETLTGLLQQHEAAKAVYVESTNKIAKQLADLEDGRKVLEGGGWLQRARAVLTQFTGGDGNRAAVENMADKFNQWSAAAPHLGPGARRASEQAKADVVKISGLHKEDQDKAVSDYMAPAVPSSTSTVDAPTEKVQKEYKKKQVEESTQEEKEKAKQAICDHYRKKFNEQKPVTNKPGCPNDQNKEDEAQLLQSFRTLGESCGKKVIAKLCDLPTT